MYRIHPIKHIGVVATRLQGTDGVSLETEKWVELLKNMRYECFFFTGQSDWDPERTMITPMASFAHPEVEEMHRHFFGTKTRNVSYSEQIHQMRKALKNQLYAFIDKFQIDLLIVENALAIPLNIPLGLAITEVIAETNIPSVGHHHDFYWERDRFMVNCINDYINMAFPPRLNSMVHVVINSEARKMLSYRRGISSTVIPNVFNYHQKAPGIDDYNRDLREKLGLKKDDILFLQPTRIVQRKGIEHAIEVIHRLNNPKIKLVITHSAKDEGSDYYDRVLDYAELLNVPVIIKPEIFKPKRIRCEDDRKCYSIWDVYPHADLITYPSTFEGFGNAFLEAIFFKKPILVNRYSIYQSDIEPYGFDVVAMDQYVSDDVINKIRHVLDDENRRRAMVEKNYELASHYFSYVILEQKLKELLINFGQF